MTLKQYITRLWADKRSFWLALAWVAFICFFTYTELFTASISTDKNFSNQFHEMHVNIISMWVNIGLIVMLMFDYTAKNETLHRNLFWTATLSMLIPLSIYLHCNLVAGQKHMLYVAPLSWNNLSIFLFVIMLIVIFVIKTIVEFSDALPVGSKK